MRKALCVLFAAALALVSLLGTASAAPGTQTKSGVTITAPATNDVSAQALSCPSGDFCAWPVSDGSSSRCAWAVADPDWQAGSIRCSWSSSRAVQAVFDNGNSSTYAGVCMYPAANYGGDIAYYVDRGQRAPGFPGVKIRSHKWVRTVAGCW
ncbi:peptidase inhibitor family I36 protein [Lentzea sp. NPDC004789]